MDLLRLEQQRQALEDNLQKLRQSLKHWQTWDSEYEGLKEEVLALDHGQISVAGLSALAESYQGDLVNEKEVRELAGLSSGSSRSVQQIIGMIERRQEYVQKNIETVQRQFFDAEAKQEEFAFASASLGGDGAVDGPGALPLTEIHEELDDDDNVISSRLTRPEEDTAKVVDSLRKAGLNQDDLKDLTAELEPQARLDELKPAIVNANPITMSAMVSSVKSPQSESAVASSPGVDADDSDRPSVRKKSVSFTADTKASPELPRPSSEDGRKSVSFAEKVAVMPAAPAPDSRSVSFSATVEEIPAEPVPAGSPILAATTEVKTIPIQADPTRQKELREAFKPGDKVIQLNDDDEIESVQVVLPENESPEDAATRREMLEYTLNEVGNVVAQMDLDPDAYPETVDDEDEDDESSHYTGSEHWEDEDTPYTTGLSESDEDEDEHGRTTGKLLSPEYRQEMLELQNRLIGNLGPAPEEAVIKEVDADLDPDDVRRLVIRNKRSSFSSASSDNSEKKAGGKKRVSFAESVDIAPPPALPLKAQKHIEGETVGPVNAQVTERSTAASHSVPAATNSARKSRFKTNHAVPTSSTNMAGPAHETIHGPETIIDAGDYNDEVPTGPPGRTLADTLTERIPTRKPALTPSNEDFADPIADRRQLAAEYYRRRNDIVKQQGGFQATPDEDEMYGELMEERDGKLKKVSRFKAARIKP